MSTPPRVIAATGISRYIRLERCGRFLRYYLQPSEAKGTEARYGLGHEPLSPLLAEAGNAFEAEVVATLPARPHSLKEQPASATVAVMRATPPGMQRFLYQATLTGTIGGRACLGVADLIHVARATDGHLSITVLDVKSATRDQVEYRMQVAFYLRLLRGMLAGGDQGAASFAGGILHRNPDGTMPPWDAPAARFAVAPYDLVLDHLFDPLAGDIAAVLATEMHDIPYALSSKCDGCTFNQLCLRESAEAQSIALVPTMRPAQIAALHNAGVTTLRALVALKELPERGQPRRAFATTPGQEATVAALVGNPLVAPEVDRLVQRARAMLHRFDPTVTAPFSLLDAAPSQLPGDGVNPHLVKVFLDAQTDYLRDRVYLAGALLVGPGGTFACVHSTAAPPDDVSEGALLLALLRDVVAALPTVAGDAGPVPLHLYLYDASEQRIWLDVLARHLDDLSSVPAFYDLLTSNGGVEQPMFSFLANEVRDRWNLGLTCPNLHSVAALLRFTWADAMHDFRRAFAFRIFDNTAQREDGVWIERRSQFSSSIPLEYAYGAWGQLPEGTHAAPQYRQCTPEVLRAFQQRRLAALAHIEARLNPGDHSRFVKDPLPVAAVTAGQPLPDLARALTEFLGMEHHAALQSLFALLQLPPERRMVTGRTLPLRCQAVAVINKRTVATCALDYAAFGLGAGSRTTARVKVGDWMVLNSLDRQQPWEIIRGRLAVVKDFAADTITLELLDMTSFGSDFKYPHEVKLVPHVGECYTLDEMADDLNADKYARAVGHADGNALYAALTSAMVTPPADIAPLARTFLAEVQQAVPGLRLTTAQADVVAGQGSTPLLCVQGPPGTGKTATLGWAILARIFAANVPTMRVLVCAKTHKATTLVLGSVAERLRQIHAARVGGPLHSLRVLKLSNDDEELLPDGVQRLNPRHTARAAELLTAAAGLVVVGGTPGGIYTLMGRVGKQAGELPWGDGPFDLLVIDEASQMSIPEALLASAFLKRGGHVIVVGDHRQMPPILAHPWPSERRRAAITYHPDRSIFAALLESGCPVVRLDESFRLHQTQARFLAEHIYHRDAIAFHSQRQATLPPLPASVRDPFIIAALRPDFPIVVIEHSEIGSQQVNATEVDLIAPIAAACGEALRLDGRDGLGIVVPHNAQKAALRERLPLLAEAGAIDTVERFQGGERDVIIVSATASDPNYILAEAEFLLNLNRLNVAFSRPRKKLIVVASAALFRFLCTDLALFEQALLWKYLRYTYADTALWGGSRAGAHVEVRGHPAGHPITATLADVAPPDLVPPIAAQPLAPLAERMREGF
ncbi:MAG: AAA family ATPase [Ktedonobacterales bacterium]|nr:AAA family ATPase [Ktedonobacterales bacterium]